MISGMYCSETQVIRMMMNEGKAIVIFLILNTINLGIINFSV